MTARIAGPPAGTEREAVRPVPRPGRTRWMPARALVRSTAWAQPPRPERGAWSRTGTAQGVLQALFAFFFMTVGVASDASVDFVRGAALKVALVIFPGAMIACGIVVDRRRIGRPLRFVAPRGARRLLGLVALALPLVAYGGLGLLVGRGASPLDVVYLVLCMTLATAPYSFAVLDRIAGPAWVLVRALRENAARKPWARHEVVEVDGARARDGRARRAFLRALRGAPRAGRRVSSGPSPSPSPSSRTDTPPSSRASPRTRRSPSAASGSAGS